MTTKSAQSRRPMKHCFRFNAPVMLHLALICVSGSALGAAPSEEPLWAYGFVTAGAPGEKATLPGPPAKALRANEDPAAQTQKRQIPGSAGSYSLLEIRNGNEVVDWFPDEHPALTPIMKHGPASMGQN